MTSIIKVDQIQLSDGSTPTAGDLGLNVTGGVLQVVSSSKTDTFSSNTGGFVDVPNLSVSITPSSTTSKILIISHLNVVNVSTTGSTARVLRGSTPVGVATGAGNRATGGFAEFYQGGRTDNFGGFPFIHLDEPLTTAETTYKVQVNPNTYNLHVNRSHTDSDSAGYTRSISSITLIEIAG